MLACVVRQKVVSGQVSSTRQSGIPCHVRLQGVSGVVTGKGRFWMQVTRSRRLRRPGEDGVEHAGYLSHTRHTGSAILEAG